VACLILFRAGFAFFYYANVEKWFRWKPLIFQVFQEIMDKLLTGNLLILAKIVQKI
jgi:hypothetical protein